MSIWTKENINAVTTHMENTRVFYYNEMLFIRPDANSNDELHTDLHAMAGSAGGAMALAVNMDYLNEVSEAGVSPAATEILSMVKDSSAKLIAIIIIDPIHALGNDVVQFIIAHELGHIAKGHTATEGIEGLKENYSKELEADKYAVDLIGTLNGFKAYFKFVAEKIVAPHIPMEISNAIITSLKGRAQALLPVGEFNNDDYKLRNF